MKKRWKLTIEYDGTEFSGWQLQADDVDTVQGRIEEAFRKFCQQDIRLHVAGRTDAGVHARGQIAHFDLDYGDRPLDGYAVCKALNAHLRSTAISILQAEVVDDEFHARFHAKNKLYIYRIVNRPASPTLDDGKAWHVPQPLNLDAMREASKILIGHHDFTSFRASQCQAKSPLRTLNRLDILSSDYDGAGGTEIEFHLEAQSFLHHQVRNMVGSLLQVGLERWTKDDLQQALEKKDRCAAGPTGPAHGLYLVRIDYT